MVTSNIVVNLSAGQLAALLGITNTLLPIIICGIGALAIFMSISDKMAALEWTTLSKVSMKGLLSSYGVGGQPALTGIQLWGLGSYKRNILYLLVGICPLLLYGASAIAPLGIHTCTVVSDVKSSDINIDVTDTDPILSIANNNSFSLKELSQIRVCGVFEYLQCPGMKDRWHVDDAYAADFNRTYSNFATRYRLLKTSFNGNISYPSYDFRMSVVTSTQRGRRVVDRMVVDHNNGGILMNQAVKPRHKIGERFNWSIKGMWLQPLVSCQSTNLTQIVNINTTIRDWNGKMVINNADLRPPTLQSRGDRSQMTDLSLRSSRYSQLIQANIMKVLNMTTNGIFYESPVYKMTSEPVTVDIFSGSTISNFNTSNDINIDIECTGFSGINNKIAENIVGVQCWKILGPPKSTGKGIEQILYGCASMVEASVKSIELQSNDTGINVISQQTIPAKWYVEKSVNNNIGDMNPWWGGVKFEEDIPKNSAIVSENSLLLPATFGRLVYARIDDAAPLALDIMSKIKDSHSGYIGNGIGNSVLLQQWKEEGTTEEGINRMFQRQWTDIMINMVTPTNQAEIVGQIQLLTNKLCYDLRYATQYFIAAIGLMAILCVSLININKGKQLVSVKHIVRHMDLGRVILNVQDRAEASTAGSSKWLKIDGKKLVSIADAGFK